MILPYPRAYVDWTIPIDENGYPIGSCSDNRLYKIYISWLANYLYYKEILIPNNQNDILKKFKKNNGVKSAVFELSDNLGYSLLDVGWIEDNFIEGVSYKKFHEKELEAWKGYSEDDKATITEGGETFFISEQEYIRIGKEKIESKKVPEHINHADIPYRAVFANLIKDVHDTNKRIKHLDYFYFNFNECASK